MNDRYTKSILTVIAVMLTVIAIQNFNFPPKAHAQVANSLGDVDKPAHVIVDEIKGLEDPMGIPVQVTNLPLRLR